MTEHLGAHIDNANPTSMTTTSPLIVTLGIAQLAAQEIELVLTSTANEVPMTTTASRRSVQYQYLECMC